MGKQVEIVFDEKTGKFVAHFSGYSTHQEEHKALDTLLAQLRKQGFNSEVEHYHDKPKLPNISQEDVGVSHSHKEKGEGL